MASTMYANLVGSYGLKSNGMQAIDVINGIPVKLVNTNGAATVYVYVGDKQKAAALVGPMADVAKSQGLIKPRVSGENILFGFKKPRMAVEEYSHIRDIISANAGALNNDQCPYCGMSGCDVAGMYKGGVARKMHRACYLNNRNTEMDKIENASGNIVTGILGALIAAVLVVAFAELMVLGANRIFYILYLGFPLFVAGGFRMGKGPYGAKGTICHVTISVLAMFAYFYIQGCYYAADWYGVSMLTAIPYFNDIMTIILDPEFIRYSALEIVLFFVGLLIAIFANPTSKKNGRKEIQQNDVFITPVASNDFSGYNAYNAYEDQNWQNNNTTEQYQNAYDNSVNNTASNDYVDVYGNSGQDNNNGFGN